jgi:hypothetical protein
MSGNRQSPSSRAPAAVMRARASKKAPTIIAPVLLPVIATPLFLVTGSKVVSFRGEDDPSRLFYMEATACTVSISVFSGAR